MTAETTKPLYKVLNEKRIGGIFSVDESSNDLDILIKSTNSIQPIFISLEDGKAEPYRNKELIKNTAEYTALAVNNFEKLVDVLNHFLYNWDALGNGNDYTMTATRAREALKSIS